MTSRRELVPQNMRHWKVSMRNGILRLVYGIGIFLLTIVLLESLPTHENSEVTVDLEDATFPVVTMQADGVNVGELHGYTTERDISLFHASITPIKEDRTVTFTVDPCGGEVTGLSFELRTISGSRLIENGQIRNSETGADGVITGSVTLQNLIEEDTEYMFILLVQTSSEKDLRYYTRILEKDSSYHDALSNELDFVQKFHDAAIDGGDDALISRCLETDSSQQSSDLSTVSLYSTLDQVKYGTLEPAELLKPVLSIRDTAGDVTEFSLHYILTTGDGDTAAYYDCSEWYRVRQGTDRVYLLNYRRTMDQIFDPKNTDNFAANQISLGITGSGLQLVESPGGTAFAFVDAGRLYGCIPADQTISTIFSFADPDSTDRREVNPDYGIRILDVDESGNVTFAVYGYMNRGKHEGELGTCIYAYNNEYRTVEEQAFLPCSTSMELLRSQVEKLSYYNKAGDLYILMGESVFRVDLGSRTAETIGEGLTDGSYQVSSSGQMFACSSGDSDGRGNTSELVLMNFASRTQNTITADSGEVLRPLGFIGEDFIYGIAKSADIVTDASGDVVTPMYEVRIVDSSLKVLEDYEMSGYYVTGCTVEDNLVTLERVTRSDGGGELLEAPADQIVGNEESGSGTNQLVSQDDDDLGTVQKISVRGFSAKNIRYIEPKMVLYEGSRELELPESGESGGRYFVYSMDSVTGYISDPAAAVSLADSLSGCVVDEKGLYVWNKSGRLTSNQIMAVTAESDDGSGSLAVCLDAIFSFEGVSADASKLLSSGDDTIPEVLNSTIPNARAFSLTGCSLDAALYYVSEEKPVLVMYNNYQDAVLLVGYNESIVVLMDPETGTLRRMDRDKAEEQFTGSGCTYVAYLVEDS